MRSSDDRVIRDRYWILSTLASGGMGDTYRVWDIQQRIPAVVKMPRPDVRDPSTVARRFVQELHAMLALKHEHIVPITDHGDDGDLPFVVMRFLPGGSLADYRDDRAGTQPSNPPSMLHCWLPGVAAALDFMHRHSVLHRDVKPANIFLDAFLKPYLGDFGIAKAIDGSGRMLRGEEDLTADHVAVGTEAYMAPEHFRSGDPVGPRSDQYSLAVTVYEMLSGNKPFRGDVDRIWREHCTLPPAPLDIVQLRIPPSLQAAVHRALAKRPEQRFASCEAFARAALADVPPLRLAPGVARFLCPGCKSIIRLDISRAGTAGVCMKCKRVLEVANDLSALWARDETVAVRSASPGGSGEDAGRYDRATALRGLLDRLGVIGTGLLGWLNTVGVAAMIAAGVGGAAAWIANEARWRSHVAGAIDDSRVALERASREIESLRQQLRAARAAPPVSPVAARGDGAATSRSEDARRKSEPEPSRPQAVVVDEDDEGLPSAR